MKSVILTGFMGTGKSSVGKFLAGKLGCGYYDLDSMIVADVGMSINDIFACHGEQHFRLLEKKAIDNLSSAGCCVISTGGGAVIDPENRRRLRAAGTVINLTASAEAIRDRLKDETDRPLLKDGKSLEKIAAMLAERESFYADADMRIDTVGKTVDDVAAEILHFLEEEGRT